MGVMPLQMEVATGTFGLSEEQHCTARVWVPKPHEREQAEY